MRVTNVEFSHAPHFLDGCPLHSSARSHLLASSFGTRTRIVARVQARGRLQARHLRPGDRLLPEARRGKRSAHAGRNGADVVRASVVLRPRVEPGEPGQRREVSPDRAAARASGRPDGCRRASSGPGGQSVRPHRRRAALDRGRGRPAHSATRVRPAGTRGRSQDQTDLRQRYPDAVAVDQPGRPEHRGEVVHGKCRHVVRDRAADGALSEIRRARQQP